MWNIATIALASALITRLGNLYKAMCPADCIEFDSSATIRSLWFDYCSSHKKFVKLPYLPTHITDT